MPFASPSNLLLSLSAALLVSCCESHYSGSLRLVNVPAGDRDSLSSSDVALIQAMDREVARYLGRTSDPVLEEYYHCLERMVRSRSRSVVQTTEYAHYPNIYITEASPSSSLPPHPETPPSSQPSAANSSPESQPSSTVESEVPVIVEDSEEPVLPLTSGLLQAEPAEDSLSPSDDALIQAMDREVARYLRTASDPVSVPSSQAVDSHGWDFRRARRGNSSSRTVIFRHGKRTPADTYPTDPHVQHDFQPYGWGQLTNEGKMEQYQQGKFLRVRYGEFLGDEWRSEEVRVQSTDADRSIASAQLMCAGLFPPTGTQRWKPDLDWHPVPVHTQPLDQDSLLLVRIPCPRYHEARDEVMATGSIREYQSSLTDLYKALSTHTGLQIHDPDDVQSLYSTLLAETQFNLTLPEWTSGYFPERMAGVTAFSFTLNAYNNELKRLKGGPLLKKILKEVETKTKEPLSKKKMFIYSGHDSTVANLMMALQVWEEQIPVYNIMAMIELHQMKEAYGLKVFLRNSTEHEPYLLKIPGCDEICPLDKVKELSYDVLPIDLEKECASHDPFYAPPPASGP